MKRKRHTSEHIIRKLRTAEQLRKQDQSAPCLPCAGGVGPDLSPLAAALRRVKATEAKRLKELEQENPRLKHLLADAELDRSMCRVLA